jgi:hypothetical protein
MSTWILGDAIILSGGRVVGSGPDACSMRGLFECVPSQVTITLGGSPGRVERVDLNNDWMLDRWLRERGVREGVCFLSDYSPHVEDIPARLRKRP